MFFCFLFIICVQICICNVHKMQVKFRQHGQFAIGLVEKSLYFNMLGIRCSVAQKLITILWPAGHDLHGLKYEFRRHVFK